MLIKAQDIFLHLNNLHCIYRSTIFLCCTFHEGCPRGFSTGSSPSMGNGGISTNISLFPDKDNLHNAQGTTFYNGHTRCLTLPQLECDVCIAGLEINQHQTGHSVSCSKLIIFQQQLMFVSVCGVPWKIPPHSAQLYRMTLGCGHCIAFQDYLANAHSRGMSHPLCSCLEDCVGDTGDA